MFAALLLSVLGYAVKRPQVEHRQPKKFPSVDCITCRIAVPIIEKKLKDGATIAEITKQAESVCQYVEEEVQSICIQVIDHRLHRAGYGVDQCLRSAWHLHLNFARYHRNIFSPRQSKK